jgi:hypothetical protein
MLILPLLYVNLHQFSVTKNVSAVVQSMCNTNGTACTLDANHAALNSTGANDVLKVLWRCSWYVSSSLSNSINQEAIGLL